MLDSNNKLEVINKVNKLIKKANNSLNLGLKQPIITYTLSGSNIVEVHGNTINFNENVDNIDNNVIEKQVAHVINFELNHETPNPDSETYVNIINVLKGKTPVIINVTPSIKVDKKVITAKTKKRATGSIKLKAINAYKKAMRANMKITRQEMIEVLYKEFNLDADPKGKMKASNYYTTAKKVVEL